MRRDDGNMSAASPAPENYFEIKDPNNRVPLKGFKGGYIYIYRDISGLYKGPRAPRLGTINRILVFGP